MWTPSFQIRQRLSRLPIYYRIVIGNAIVIAIGAVGGTLTTRHLAGEAADLWLILLFTLVGTLLSVLLNSWIVHQALYPLRQLRRLVDRVRAGKAEIDPSLLRESDPDISQLAVALSSLVHLLETRNLQLRALSERAINAQEEERQSIARSLHDDTGQTLSTLIFNLEWLENHLSPHAIELRGKIAATRTMAVNALKELRKIVYGLRPTILDDLGLAPAIRWYARTNLEESGFVLHYEAPDEFPPLSPYLTSTLFRIAQEAINNIARHSAATLATISLRQDDGQVHLNISDNGRGFDVVQTAEQAVRLQRLGLLGIKERAELVGGQVIITSAPDQGTQIEVILPL
jgi:two-component system sensor histidine kinase UhpB